MGPTALSTSATAFGSQKSLLGPAPCQKQQRSPFSKSRASPGSAESPFLGAGGEDSLDVHRKKEKASRGSSGWGGIECTILEVAYHSQPKVKIIPTMLLAIRKKQKNSNL